mgnify:CR=1 FL=1
MNPDKDRRGNLRKKPKLVRIFREYWWRILLFLLLFLPAVIIQNRSLMEMLKKPRIYQDSLYLPSGNSIHMASLGYDRFMADFIWLRSIQAYGGHWETDREYSSIFHLFDVITDLDPHFIDAYTFGNMVMGDDGGEQEAGLRLIDKGIIKNPDKYKLPYWGGYVAYWEMNDPELAKYYYTLAQKADDAPDFVNRILAYMEMKSGRYHVAFEKYLRDWLEAIDNDDDVVVGIASRRILDVVNDWQKFILKRAIEKYFNETGKIPRNINELAEANVIEPFSMINIPLLQQLMEYYENQPGPAVDHFREIVNLVTTQNYTKIPPHPHGYWYQLSPVWDFFSGQYLVDGQILMEKVEKFIKGTRLAILRFYDENGRYPYSIYEIPGERHKAQEPLGGKWLYNPVTGNFKSSTLPFI